MASGVSLFNLILFQKVHLLLLPIILFQVLIVLNNPTAAIASIPESVELMKGKVIRVFIADYPPSFTITRLQNGDIEYGGTSFESIEAMANVLKLKVEFVVASDEELKKYGIGPLQAEAMMLDRADLAPIGLISSPLRYQQIDVSVPKVIEPFILIVPWPNEQSHLLATIRPFTPMVWLCLGVTLLFLAPFLTFLSGFYLRYVGNGASVIQRRQPIMNFANFLHNGTFLLSHITNQGYRYNLRFRSHGSAIVVGLWCLTAVVLANAYGGVLFSFLSVNKLEPAIKSLDELAASKNVRLVTLRGLQLTNRFLSATNGTEKLIGDSLRAYPDTLIHSQNDAKNKLMTGSYAFPYFKLYVYPLIVSTYRENGNKCRLTIAREPISVFSPAGMALQKNGPFTIAVNEQIQAQIESGLMAYFYSKATPRVDQCKMENQNASARQTSLTLLEMSPAFVILGLGVSLSILVFLLELIFKRIQNRYFNHN